ncbi:MAG: phage terminase small subunit P27 family [Alkaliphilus sp.]|nr:phage terminase small subunit P27 family [bacterium AH-315-E09]PHS29517.1 MAG: phage terminase small subunit P27 family [Alkaliphilus sp.]
MGKTGALPKSQKLRLIENDNKDRKTLPVPKPNAPKRPLCPRWLDSEGQKEWRRVAPELYRMGLLTELDVNALANYCRTTTLYKQTQLFLQENGLVDDKGTKRPEVGVGQEAAKESRQWGKLFGLSPACRMRLEMPEPNTDEVSEFEALLDE